MTSFSNISRNFDFSTVQDNMKKRLQASRNNDSAINNESVVYGDSSKQPVLFEYEENAFIDDEIETKPQPQYVDILEEEDEAVIDDIEDAVSNPIESEEITLGTEIKYDPELFENGKLNDLLGTFGLLQSARSVINYD